MLRKDADSFRAAAALLGGSAAGLFDRIAEEDLARAGEIRLRAGAPAALSLPSGVILCNSQPISREDIEEMVFCLCGSSIYTHQHEMAEGYIPLPGGHRAGVSGRAVIENGRVVAVSDVTSICLRIARDKPGCAAGLVERLFGGGLRGAIIAGAPGSGKTTVLRDLACALALGRTGRAYRVTAADERGELGCASSDTPGRLESCCDVLTGYPKAEGIMQAVRCLAPEVIVCDEVGSIEDARAVCAAVNAGAAMLCSMHAGSAGELLRRPQARELLETGAFERIVMLKGRESPGQVDCIWETEELYEAAGRDSADCLRRTYRRIIEGQAPAQSRTSC